MELLACIYRKHIESKAYRTILVVTQNFSQDMRARGTEVANCVAVVFYSEDVAIDCPYAFGSFLSKLIRKRIRMAR